MRIAFLSPEVVPFVKTGGLADVAGALPKALTGLGQHVDVILPKYRAIRAEEFGLVKITSPLSFPVPVGTEMESASIWKAVIPGTSVQAYFIEHDGYFDRDGLYVNPATGKDYPDNAARFLFFSRAALGLITALDLNPDIIHCNDYQTGLVPAYLKLLCQDDPILANVATLYSIHNLSYQGLYLPETMELIGLNNGLFYPMGPFEFWGQVNFMKAGIVYADLLNTVSERYAQEIQSSEEFGCGLEGVLRERSADLYGILNGVDYDEWNSETDTFLPVHYNLTDLSGKRLNKEALLKEFGLPPPPGDVPVIGMVSRLAPQKGFDILAECLDRLVELDVQFVILGAGMKEYHELLTRAAAEYPDKIGVKLTFDNRRAHLIEAGSDVFLMPSRYEPCGLNQIYSLRYGTIPVVRETGGLADTIQDYNPATGQGTGFVFKEYTAEALLGAVKRAVQTYRNVPAWHEMMRRAMMADFSWTSSAKKYIALYEKAVEKRRGSGFGVRG